jgi:hypothetical protein
MAAGITFARIRKGLDTSLLAARNHFLGWKNAIGDTVIASTVAMAAIGPRFTLDTKLRNQTFETAPDRT